MRGIMFDSNAFDKILDGTIKIEDLEKSKEIFDYYITHIQTDELSNVPDSKKEKRNRFTLFLLHLAPRIIPTSCTILGHSRLNYCCLGKAEYYNQLLNESKNNINDSIIGETAIKNNLVIVTEDEKFKKKIIDIGGEAKTVSEFLNLIKEESKWNKNL